MRAWAHNGDMISLQYTGTESNNTRVTTQNKQGLLGKLEQMHVGLKRYQQLLYHDKFKQQCIQLLTCDKDRWGSDDSIQKLDYGVRALIAD